mgnify:FL=1
MGRKRLTLSKNNGHRPSIVSDRKKQDDLKGMDFLDLHDKFIAM